MRCGVFSFFLGCFCFGVIAMNNTAISHYLYKWFIEIKCRTSSRTDVAINLLSLLLEGKQEETQRMKKEQFQWRLERDQMCPSQ